MKKIKSFAAACKAKGLDPNKLPDVSMLPKEHQKSIVAFYMLTIIVSALNEGWQPNWSDENEEKYYNWFCIKADKKRPSGFGFSDSNSYYGCDYADTHCGSRFYFKTRELAEYAREKFAKLYQDYFLLPN